jgi:hypothetical protein
MLTIRLKGSGGGEVSPALICTACRASMSLHEAWIAFPAVTDANPEGVGIWIHKQCLSGNTLRLVGSARTTLWRALDYLSRILRDTQTPPPEPDEESERRSVRAKNARVAR